MNDYEDVYDEWLWSCLWWMIMKLFMMIDYEVVYDDDVMLMLYDLWYDAIWFMIWCLCLLDDDMWRCYDY